MAARDFKSSRDLVVEHDKPPRKHIIRRLTPLECCRLQGFSDGWASQAVRRGAGVLAGGTRHLCRDWRQASQKVQSRSTERPAHGQRRVQNVGRRHRTSMLSVRAGGNSKGIQKKLNTCITTGRHLKAAHSGKEKT